MPPHPQFTGMYGAPSSYYPSAAGRNLAGGPPSVPYLANQTSVGAPMVQTLVAELTLPSNLKLIFPRTPEWRQLMEYVRKVLAQNSDLRIPDWPVDLRRCLNYHWSVSASDAYRNNPNYPGDYWMYLGAKGLLRWLEELEADKPVGSDRMSSMEALHRTVIDNPMRINFHEATLNRHGIMVSSLIIERAYYDHLDAYPLNLNGNGPPGLTSTDRRLICKSILDSVAVTGLEPGAKVNYLNKIRSIALLKADPEDGGSIASIPNLLMSLQEATTELLSANFSHSRTFSAPPSNPRPPKGDSGRQDRGLRDAKAPKPKKGNGAPVTKTPSENRICRRCGYTITKAKNYVCPRETCASDPRCNKEDKEWADSRVGKQWLAKGLRTIPKDPSKTLENTTLTPRGISTYALHNDKILSNELIPFTLSVQENLPRNERKRSAVVPPPPGKLLLDTGALGSNVMSAEYAKRIRVSRECYSTAAARHSIETAAKNNLISNKIINVKVNLVNERKELANKPLSITAAVAPIAVDLILDRQTIKDNNLVHRFPSHFAQGELRDRIAKLPLKTKELTILSNSTLPLETSSASYALLDTINVNPEKDCWLGMHQSVAKEAAKSFFRDQLEATLDKKRTLEQAEIPLTQDDWDSLTARPHVRMKKKKRASKQKRNRPGKPPSITNKEAKRFNKLFLAAIRSTSEASNLSDKSPYEREGKLALDEIPGHKLESVPTELINSEEESDAYLKVHVDGSPELSAQLKEIVAEFKDIFKSTVQRDPSSAFEPFQLEVDDSLWKQPCNSTPPRTMGLAREQELDRMLKVLLERGLIEDCSDAYYSHAFLTPKPNGSWRLVLDFKGLNRATTSKYAWPIPNIKDMLNRVGNSRPSFFAVFDLTSGYYQAPIHEESRKYTAFKTRKAVYR